MSDSTIIERIESLKPRIEPRDPIGISEGRGYEWLEVVNIVIDVALTDDEFDAVTALIKANGIKFNSGCVDNQKQRTFWCVEVPFRRIGAGFKGLISGISD